MVTSVLTILRTYPSCDIQRKDGTALRKQVATSEVSEELLRSYVSVYGDLVIVPKKMMGNSPVRMEQEAMTILKDSFQGSATALSGFDTMPTPASGGGNGELYRIMYDRERSESQEYKRRYEDTLSELRKLEVEHASNKKNLVGDIAQGLAGFAPYLMKGGMAGLGEAPAEQPKPLPNMQPVSDKRLLAIIGYWPKLDEPTRQSVYNVVAALLGNPSKAEAALAAIDEGEDYTNH